MQVANTARQIRRVTVPALIWTDPRTGKTVDYSPVINLLRIGSKQATSTMGLLRFLGLVDRDGNRRKLRAVIDYYFHDMGIPICASQKGYFIAGSSKDLFLSAREKEKKAEALSNTAMELRVRAEAMEAKEHTRAIA